MPEMVKSERVCIKERIAKMIDLNPLNLKLPVQAKVARVKIESHDDQSNVLIYFHGPRFDTCQTTLTHDLAKDLKNICRTQFIDGWIGKEVQLITEEGSIRAKLP
jgi:hypothetical protein